MSIFLERHTPVATERIVYASIDSMCSLETSFNLKDNSIGILKRNLKNFTLS